MAFCGTCGTQVADGTRFCGKCGAAVAAGPTATPPPPGGYQQQPPPYTGQPQPGYVPPPPGPGAGGMTDNLASALCYTPFLGWIWAIVALVVDPYKSNRAIRFHAFQAIFLAVCIFVVNFVVGIVLGIMVVASGSYMLYRLSWLVSLAAIALEAYMMYQTYNNQKTVLPVIGDLANKQA